MRVLMLLLIAMPAFADDVFSHKTHANVNLKCTFCHKGAKTLERAGFPDVKTCKTCHPDRQQKAIPTRRVYQARDFVFFSHVKHTAAAKAECAACHGDVKSQAAIQKHRSLNMADCIECHKQSGIAAACNACHELGQ